MILILEQSWAIIQCIAILALISQALGIVDNDPVADQQSWIVAGSGIDGWRDGHSPLCSQVGMNALGAPFIQSNSAPGFNRSIGLYNTKFYHIMERNALWVYNSSTMAIQIQWWSPHEQLLCLDSMLQNSFDPSDPFPLRILNCTGEIRQQWVLEGWDASEPAKSVRRIRSAMQGTNGESLYIRGQRFNSTEFPWNVLGLYLDWRDDGQSISSFTFVPVPEKRNSLASLAVQVPSRGDGLSNLVANGGFESSGLVSPGDWAILEATVHQEKPFLCSWTVAKGSIKLVQTSPWSWPAKEGLRSLQLGPRDGSHPVMITQFVRTIPGAHYQFSFFMLAAGRMCFKNQTQVTKTVVVEISPASNNSAVARHRESIHITPENESIGWIQSTFRFTALSNVSNVSFINNMSHHNCNPVIDYVVLTQILDGNVKMLQKWLLATCLTSGVSLLGFLVLLRKRIWCLQCLHGYKLKAKIVDVGSPESAYSLVNTFSLKQIKMATRNFKTKVGQGGFGAVYRTKLQDGKWGAVKRATSGKSEPANFRQELSVLLRLRHPNLVNLLGICCERGEQILVFEFVGNGSLFDRLHTVKGKAHPLPWTTRMQIALDVARAIEYLHEMASPRVIHRDIKSPNILLTEEDAGRLADFGLSKLGQQQEQWTPPKGSHGYIDPHYIWTGELSEKSDIYSYGVVLLELITGLRAMQGCETLAEWSKEHRRDGVAMAKIVDRKLQGHFDMEDVETMTEIINRCLLDQPQDRPTIREVLALMGDYHPGRSQGNLRSPLPNYTASYCPPSSFQDPSTSWDASSCLSYCANIDAIATATATPTPTSTTSYVFSS